MRRALLIAAVGLTVLLVGGCGARLDERDPLGANAGCYVCHMTFVNEELATVHLAAKIGCIQCHGASAAHANDENVGATPPDAVIERDQINDHCRACHETHDVAPELMIARWKERQEARKPFERPTLPVICTDCHGDHTIAKAP